MTRQLRERGIYRFGPHTFIAAEGADNGYILYTAQEWENYSTADTEVDPDGTVVCLGIRTRATTDDLEDTGETAS